MAQTSFSEISEQVHMIKDVILSELQSGFGNDSEEEMLSFNKRLLATKYWFTGVSYANKKRFVLALLNDIHSAWALSLLLKAIWNCRPKDAALSVCEKNIWSSYDQAPIDHNRTAQPVRTLVQVMKTDREWFLTLKPEPQALVLAELLSVAGGPIMWTAFSHAKVMYEKYRSRQLLSIQQCSVVVREAIPAKVDSQLLSAEKGKKEQSSRRSFLVNAMSPAAQDPSSPHEPKPETKKTLQLELAQWNSIIQSIQSSLKLEELEIIFKDGSKKKIWKVNRPNPEAIESVDFLQLLPSAVGKRILSFLPLAQLNGYASVNKYWAYLVDDLKNESNSRRYIDMDIQKLKNYAGQNDSSKDTLEQVSFGIDSPRSRRYSNVSSVTMNRPRVHSFKGSEKSTALSFRSILNVRKPKGSRLPPISNVAELSERLNRRGAVDENLWEWCETVLKRCPVGITRTLPSTKPCSEGVLKLEDQYFSCPLMKQKIKLPLYPPLVTDPATSCSVKPKCISNRAVMITNTSRKVGDERFSLWSRDFSSLYPAFKIASHQYPM